MTDEASREEHQWETEDLIRVLHEYVLQLEAFARENGLGVPERPEQLSDENIRRLLGNDKPTS
jgi:hypothetical protein